MGRLLLRTVLGFSFLMVVLALALFLPAGSLHFWQAWIYLGDFALCTLLITAYLIGYDQELLAGRIKGGPVAETRKIQQLLQSIASICFLGLFIVPGLDFRFGWSHVPPSISWIALGFVTLGFFIIFLVFKENRYTRATIEVSAEQTVITTGPYSVVRHPMYAGASMLLLFTPLALGSWVAIPCVIPLLLVIIVRLLDEERLLVAHLRGYRAYRRKVRYRLIPAIW